MTMLGSGVFSLSLKTFVDFSADACRSEESLSRFTLVQGKRITSSKRQRAEHPRALPAEMRVRTLKQRPDPIQPR
jgi:hypothetical protein